MCAAPLFCRASPALSPSAHLLGQHTGIVVDGRRWVTLAVVGLLAVGGIGAAFAVESSRGPDEVEAALPVAPSTTATIATTAPPTTVRGPLGSGEPVTFAFAGDMSFEGANRARLDADPTTVLASIAPVLQAADLAVGNLETALGAAGSPWPGKEYTFRAPERALTSLRAAGFDVVSMANNHGMDYGADGLAASIAIARAQADRFVIGIGADETEAYRPFVTEVRGQRIAVIAATQVIGGSMIPAWTATAEQGGLASAKRVDRLLQEVRAARAAADTVVVFLHWGIEMETCPGDDQRSLAESLVDAGADVIVGGHAHRVQGAGRLGDALVGYGLGNFLWNAQSEESTTSGVLEVTVTGRRVDSYRWIPATIEAGTPRPLTGDAAAAAVARWESRRACTGLAP